MTNRDFKQAALFTAALLSFKFFGDYRDVLSNKDWLALGLITKVETFLPYQPICKIYESARTVYLILDGEIAVTKERLKKYTKEKIEGKILGVLRAGISFGELGVLYGTKR